MADDPRQQSRPERREQRHESRAAQTHARFLEDLMARSQLGREQAEQSAAAVLAVLKLRLFGTEGEDLEARLPITLRELLQRQPTERPGEEPAHFGRDELIRRVATRLGGVSVEQAEQAARHVFTTVRHFIDEGEAHEVESQLPPDLWSLWALDA